MVSGTRLPGESGTRVALGGDPFLQRQNEPSVAVSTRNPMHLLAGANDYRTVDMPGFSGDTVTGDAWLGLFKSFDGGQTWQSTLLPGFPQALTAQEGANSPIHGFAAAADPTVRVGTNGMFYYSGIAFDRGKNALSTVFVSRFLDLNNREGAFFNVPKNEDPIKYIDTATIDSGTAGQFMDKPWLAVDIPRSGAATCNLSINDTDADGKPIKVSQSFACGNVYLVYTVFLGKSEGNQHSKILVARSTDCGATWSKPVKITESYNLNQGATVAIDPATGAVYVAWQVFVSNSDPASIMIVKSTDGGKSFGKAVQVARTRPFNQGTRPASADDPFRLFRTNAYPTLAIDDKGRVYAAWSERGYWGKDNLEPKDGYADGSRIVVASSSDGGQTWANPYVADTSGLVPNDPSPGHDIMPSLSYAAGKLTLLFYDFRDDYYPWLFNSILANWNQPSLLPYDPSLPPADAVAFEPLPLRHTVDVRVAIAQANGNAAAKFDGSSLQASRYLSTFVLDSSNHYQALQLQSNQVNLPIFSGGTSPFLGDYIEIAASPQFIPDPNNVGKWIYNNASADASVFHAVWTDNRNVMPPPAQIGTDGTLTRSDWTKYSPPNTSDISTSASCGPDSWPGMRNQDIYTSRITQGLVLGSYGNSKPLGIERAFSIFVENTTPETPKQVYSPSSRFFRLTILKPGNVTASFEYPSTSNVTSKDIEVYSLAKVALTVFAKSTASPTASLKILAQEIDHIGGTPTNGLQSTLVLNPDSTNPVPLNVDDNNNALATKETHDPDFVPFNCADFATLPASVLSNCQGTNPPSTVTRLVIQWPNLVDPSTPALLNPALLNTTQNPALLNPALLNPALLNPALLNPALLNPALLNPALLNPALLNPALLNPALLNPALLNPALLNPALLNPALLNPALLNPALLNPALLNPALLNPALLNPALLNPALLNPALLNGAPSATDLAKLEQIAPSSVFIQGTDLAGTSTTSPTLTDLTWKVKNIGNDASSFFVAWYTNLQVKPEQILIYRTYKTPSADLSTCLLNEAGLHYEFLANILSPSLLNPAQLNRALTFSVAPEDQVYITMRFKDPDGQQGPQGVIPGQVGIGVVPEPPSTNERPSTSTVLLAMPNPSVYGQSVAFTATVFSVSGTPNAGTVTFKEGGTTLGSGPVINGQATSSTSTLPAGTHTITAVYSGDPTTFKGSTSEPVILLVNQATPLVAVVGGISIYDGNPHPATATATGVGGAPVAGSFSFTYTPPGDSSPPVAVGDYSVSAAFTSSDANYSNGTGSGTITISSPPVASLEFVQQPRNGPADQNLAEVQVRAKDSGGGVLPNVAITISISASACTGCTLSGTTAFTDATGVAHFSNLVLDRGGWDYTLMASAGSPAVSVSSNAFDVVGFCPTANMSSTRTYHTATLLPNGKVLLVGGGDPLRQSAELFDPTGNGGLGSFSATGDLITARSLHTATLLPNGKVLIVGGWDGSAQYASAELFDPTGNGGLGSFSATGLLAVPRMWHTATLLPSGKVLVAGGYSGGNYQPSAELYDPATGIWTATGPLSVARDEHTATLLPSGKVLVAGGYGNPGKLSSAELYDPATGTWSSTGSLTLGGRNTHTATVLPNGKVLVVGGELQDLLGIHVYEKSAELYNPVTGTWSATGSLSVGREFHAATLLPSGKVLVAGGYSATDFSTQSAELYDPTTGSWSAPGSLAVGRTYSTITPLLNGKVLVAGGYSGPSGGYLASAELYYPDRTQLIFTPQPGNATAGVAMSTVRVQVVDKDGNGISGVGVSIGIVPTSCPTCTLSGTMPISTDTNGYAAFSDLIANKGGWGYKLFASASSLGVMAASNPFDVAGFCDTGSQSTVRYRGTMTLLPSGKVLFAAGDGGTSVLKSAEIYDRATGIWSSTGDLNVERFSHAALLLPNGKVLVEGGNGTPASGILSSAELYDPTAGTWSLTGSLNAKRTQHTATLLANGKVMVSGGQDPGGAGILSSVEIYDLSSPTWIYGNSLQTARYGHTATPLPDGKVLVAGGFDGSGPLLTAEIYNPGTGMWSYTTGSLNAARGFHTATLLPDGRVLIAGGEDGTGSLSSAEIYDPGTGLWSYTANQLHQARSEHTATLLPNGMVLVTGGKSGTSVWSSAEIYDPGAGAFSITGPMVHNRGLHSALLLPNGTILVAGGSSLTQDAELFYPLDPPFPAGGFSPTGSMTTARTQSSATLLPNGKVLVIGGTTDLTTPLGTAEIYDPAAGSFGAAPPLVTARFAHTATLLANGKVLITGGQTAAGISNTAEVYDPATGSAFTTGTMIYQRRNHTATLLPNGKVLVAGGSAATKLEIYDLATDGFTELSPGCPVPPCPLWGTHYEHTATLLPDGRVLISSGSWTTLFESWNYLTGGIIHGPGPASRGGGMTASLLQHGASMGTVLLAGGTSHAGEWLYDVLTNTLSNTGSLATQRSFHTGTVLPSGKVLIAGGTTATSPFAVTSTTELYDPISRIFAYGAPMGTARTEHAAILLPNGKVLIVGGRNAGGTLNSAELYTPAR
jgi:hypothetical protein